MLKSILLSLSFTILYLFSNPLITPGLYITYPENEAIVSGIVEIRGSIPAENFESAEILYSYSGSNTPNWFQVVKLDQAIQDGVLANWDTTTITDGIYQLKLTVTQLNGKVNEAIVQNIHVMNYTHAEATLSNSQAFPNPTPLSDKTTSVLPLQPTHLPENPAAINENQFKLSLMTGVLTGVILIGLLLVYSAVRGWRRRN
jgi:hypothetical protein